jgi:hypothetical protein
VSHRINREEIKRILEANENENTTYQNLWDTAKTVLRGKFIVMNAHIERTERSQIKKPNTTSQTPKKTRTTKA